MDFTTVFCLNQPLTIHFLFSHPWGSVTLHWFPISPNLFLSIWNSSYSYCITHTNSTCNKILGDLRNAECNNWGWMPFFRAAVLNLTFSLKETCSAQSSHCGLKVNLLFQSFHYPHHSWARHGSCAALWTHVSNSIGNSFTDEHRLFKKTRQHHLLTRICTVNSLG